MKQQKGKISDGFKIIVDIICFASVMTFANYGYIRFFGFNLITCATMATMSMFIGATFGMIYYQKGKIRQLEDQLKS